MRRVSSVARLLPALTAKNAAAERARLVKAVSEGATAVPRWEIRRSRVPSEVWRALECARFLASSLEWPALSTLYLDRLDELELEVAMIEALGDPKRVRPLAARRFGTGQRCLEAPGTLSMARIARGLLASLPHEQEPHCVPPTAPAGKTSLAARMAALAKAARLEVEIHVEPRLTAGAATGDRTLYIADRRFGERESLRFAVHEVLGHAVAAGNARRQPLRLFEVGTAGAFWDQEGLAVTLEELAGCLDAYRLRVIAARVVATDHMHTGCPFGETALRLMRDHGFSAADAVTIAERAYRGGGVARDAGYLYGWLRVRSALRSGQTTVDQLRIGRVGLDALGVVPELIALGFARPPYYRPSLAESLAATDAGTSRDTSPPSLAASLTMLDET